MHSMLARPNHPRAAPISWAEAARLVALPAARAGAPCPGLDRVVDARKIRWRRRRLGASGWFADRQEANQQGYKR